MGRLGRNLVLSRVVIALAAGSVMAQAQASPPEQESRPFYKRFSFGVRAGGIPTKGMAGFERESSTESPAENIKDFSKSAARRFTIGPSLHFALSDRLGLNADFLYRRSGYDSGTTRNVRNSDGSSGDFRSGVYERTRADFWDIPVQARFYHQGPEESGPRWFASGGLTIRTVTAIKTFTERINEKKLSDTDTAPVRPTHKSVAGFVAGGGLQVRDEVGLKVELEGRFTRWFQRIFDTNLSRMNLHQVEVLLSFTF
jgi:hypothetical protein